MVARALGPLRSSWSLRPHLIDLQLHLTEVSTPSLGGTRCYCPILQTRRVRPRATQISPGLEGAGSRAHAGSALSRGHLWAHEVTA